MNIRQKAFTLIELLVVIAIIAILAAILFPVFAQAKVAAKAAVVLSNQKQIAIGATLYSGDADDAMLAAYSRTSLASGGSIQRPDIISWPVMIYPYIKNGLPTTPKSESDTNIVPTGVQFNSLWTESAWKKGAETADCDGTDAFKSYVPVKWTHSHFGVTIPFNNIPGKNYFSPAAAGPGTQADPDYYFAGSYLAGRNYNGTDTTSRNVTMSADQVVRPAETAYLTDGYTGVVQSNIFLFTVGCESGSLYKGGGNVNFLDSHVKFVKGNSQRYLAQDGSGRWYQKYFTMDR